MQVVYFSREQWFNLFGFDFVENQSENECEKNESLEHGKRIVFHSPATRCLS